MKRFAKSIVPGLVLLLFTLSPEAAPPRQNQNGSSTQDPAAKPQSKEPRAVQEPIRVEVDEVIAAVTVTDRTGEFVLDLSQKDFHVFDDGLEQIIDHWDLGGDPLAVVLVLETSTRLRAIVPVIHSMGSIFTETAMALDGEAAVVTYDSTADVRQPFTQDHDAVENAIASAKFEVPQTNLYDAMAAAVRLLKAHPPERRRIMLIVGESQDTDSSAKLGQVVRDAEHANISIYAVGPSSAAADLRGSNGPTPLKVPGLPPIAAGAPSDLGGHASFDWMTPAIWLLERGTNEIKNHQLQVAAAATGGIHYRAIRDSTIRSALDKIGGELHAQYIISYKPSAPHDAGFHSINVTVSRPNVSVRTRPGYYLAAPTN
jgi:VWFA-related protein